MAGLLDANQHCGNAQALEVLTKMADWVKFRVDRLSHEQMQKSLETEHGGMTEAFANLYAVTGNPDHLRLARAFNHEAIIDPLAQGKDELNGKHANTQIPKIIGAGVVRSFMESVGVFDFNEGNMGKLLIGPCEGDAPF